MWTSEAEDGVAKGRGRAWKRGLHSGPCEGRSLNRWKVGGSRKVRVKLSQRRPEEGN